MTYRELIAATREPGPIFADVVAAYDVVNVQVVKSDLRSTLRWRADADGGLDATAPVTLIDHPVYDRILTAPQEGI